MFVNQVVVVRADHKNLTLVAMEMIYMFFDRLTDRFGDRPDRPPLDLYDREAFDLFCMDYITNSKGPDPTRSRELPL